MLKTVKRYFSDLHKDEKGQTFIELGLAIVLIALAGAAYLNNLQKNGIGAKYNDITTQLQSVPVPTLN